MTDLTITRRHSAVALEIGKAYNFTFAGKRFRGVCIFDGMADRKIRNASGALVPHAFREARFTDCVEVK